LHDADYPTPAKGWEQAKMLLRARFSNGWKKTSKAQALSRECLAQDYKNCGY
jgi:hypothetical protein